MHRSQFFKNSDFIRSILFFIRQTKMLLSEYKLQTKTYLSTLLTVNIHSDTADCILGQPPPPHNNHSLITLRTSAGTYNNAMFIYFLRLKSFTVFSFVKT